MKSWFIRIILLCVALFILVRAIHGCQTVVSPIEQPVVTNETPPAPQFNRTAIIGESFSLEKQRGKVVLIDFWATWCPPCRAMIPVLIDLKQKYSSQELSIVGVALDEKGADVVRPFIDKMGINYPIILPTQKLLKDYGPIQSIPTLIVLDRQGRIRRRLIGVHSKEELEELISSLLADESNSPINIEFGSTGDNQSLDNGLESGEVAPSLALTEWISETKPTTESLRGKVIMLDFFQIICPGCKAVHPHIVDLWKRYRTQGLEVISIAVAFELFDMQTRDLIRKYVREHDFPYPVAIDQGLRTTFDRYRSRGTPYVALIDREGKLQYMDFYRSERVESIVRKLIGNK